LTWREDLSARGGNFVTEPESLDESAREIFSGSGAFSLAMNRLRTLARHCWMMLLWVGSGAITATSLAYFQGDELAPFVIEKLPLPAEELWLGALRIHVLAAALALPGCLLLSSTTLLRRWPRLHRWLGRATGVVVLLTLVPSGLYLALFAKGGLLATLGFALSGAIVTAAMLQAVRAARGGRFAEHRRGALHVLGQLSVAVTSRVLLVIFDAAAVDAEQAYLVSLWLPVLGSLLAVELVVSRFNPLVLLRRRYEMARRARSGGRVSCAGRTAG
jgi:hypothetical protein